MFQCSNLAISYLFSTCTHPKCITQHITIWFYPPEPSPLSGCLATANLEFNLRRGRLLPDRQMVRGGGKRCWEIHPLTSIAHSVILSVLSLYFCGFKSEREWGAKRKTERERVCVEDLWVCLQGGSSSPCAQNLLHNLPAYFKVLMQYCFSGFCCCLLPLSPIFCLIVIHAQSVCLANLLAVRPSQQSYFMSVCHWVYFVLSFVLSASPWWFTPLSL